MPKLGQVVIKGGAPSKSPDLAGLFKPPASGVSAVKNTLFSASAKPAFSDYASFLSQSATGSTVLDPFHKLVSNRLEDLTRIYGDPIPVPKTPGVYVPGKTGTFPQRPAVSVHPPGFLPPRSPPPNGKVTPNPDVSTLMAKVSLGPGHSLEFHQAVAGPSTIAVVEIGTREVTPVRRVTTNHVPWERLTAEQLYLELTGLELPPRDTTRAAPRQPSATPLVDLTTVWFDPVTGLPGPVRLRGTELMTEPYPDLDAGSNQTTESDIYKSLTQPIGGALDLRAVARAGLSDVSIDPFTSGIVATYWAKVFCKDNPYTDPDSTFCALDKGRVSAGAVHTAYYEAAAAARIHDARFSVEQFDYGSEEWVPAFEASLNAGSWVLYSRLADSPEVVKGSSELSYRTQLRGGVVHFMQRYRRVPTYLKSVGKFPARWDSDFANDIQGVTHDREWWYFSRTNYSIGDPVGGELARAHVSSNISDEDQWEPRHDDPAAPPRELIRTEGLDAAEPEPHEWKALGLAHYGGMCFVEDPMTGEGHLFVPVERDGDSEEEGNGRCGIAVFNPQLHPIGLSLLPFDGFNCGWLAYNPREERFYTNVGGYNSGVLARYKIDVSAGAPLSTSPYTSSINVTRIDPGQDPKDQKDPKNRWYTDITMSRVFGIQSGAFSDRGTLWVVGSNVFAVDVITGYAYQRATLTHAVEGEGVTVWDLTGGQAPGIGGHLHIQLLDNEDFGNDLLSFWHLEALRPEAL